MVCRLLTALALYLCFANTFPGLSASEPSIYTDLARLLDEGTFVEFDDETFDRSRASLLDALKNAPTEIAVDEWSYLRTGSVARAMEQDSADRYARLTNLVDKLNQDFSPYEEPQLLELRSLLRRHLLLIDNRRQRDQHRLSFQREKESLREALAAFEESGSRKQHRRLATGIRWMQDHEMASEFVGAAKQRLSFPNFEARLPTSLLRSVTFTTLPTQNEVIDQTSDGIRTRGSGEFKSHAYLKPISTIDQGDFRLQFQGEFRLSATNSRQRIRFRSNATTWTSGVAAIAIDENFSFSFGDLQVCASTNLRNGSVCVDRRIGKRVIGRVVDRVIKKKTPEIERDLSRDLRDRVQKELGTQIADLIDKANTVVKDRFWSPARRLDLAPRQVSVATTNEHAQITLLEDSRCGLAAPRPFRAPLDGVGFAALHASLATDVMNSVYVRHMHPAALNGDLVQRLNASLPVQAFEEVELPNECRLTFELNFPRPFQVAFENDVVHLTIKAKRIVLDDMPYLGRDLTLSYRISVRSDNHVHFELQGAPRLTSVRSGVDRDPPELIKTIRNELLVGLLPAFTLDLNGLFNGDESLPLRIARIASDQGWLVFSLGPRVEARIALTR